MDAPENVAAPAAAAATVSNPTSPKSPTALASLSPSPPPVSPASSLAGREASQVPGAARTGALAPAASPPAAASALAEPTADASAMMASVKAPAAVVLTPERGNADSAGARRARGSGGAPQGLSLMGALLEGQRSVVADGGLATRTEAEADGLEEPAGGGSAGLGSGSGEDAAPAAPSASIVGGPAPQQAVAKKSLGGFLRGALSGLAGVVVQVASAAGLDGLAESLAEAAEQREVKFGEDVDAGPDVASRSLSQRFRSGVKRSLSMSRRRRCDDGEDPELEEGLHFNLTERQQRLRAEASKFAAEAADPQAVRQREAAGAFPQEALAAAAGHGYGRLLIPKSRGGLGLGMDATCGIMEALGGSDLPFAGLLAAHNAVNYLLSTYGTSKILEKLVRQMNSLSSLGALAVSEAPGGSDIISIATTVEKDASGQFYTLSGSKGWVAGGAAADVLLVLVRSSVEPRKGLSLFALTKNMTGVFVGKPVAMSGWRSCPVVPVSFNKVVVRTEYLIGREGQGLELLQEAYSLMRTWLAAATVSYGEALLTSALGAAPGPGVGGGVASGLVPGLGGGALERQAGQMELVKARMQLEAARLLYRAAAQQLDCKSPTAACEACTAKVYAVRAAQRAAETALRQLGWRAVQTDQPCHAALRNLYAADFVGGPPDSLYGTIFAEIYRVAAA